MNIKKDINNDKDKKHKKHKKQILKFGILVELILLISLIFVFSYYNKNDKTFATMSATPSKDYITWVDFDITHKALKKAYQIGRAHV